ncbi:DUF4148 domain-containing protein [Caballeronia sp. LZ035]|uniref:DUF4148 domain-containing protein n=1 Tax=Caballeronia sp. LZ035 TaxID=3038568 RepID=UPI0028661068|nr:DUF4148 domain-containing protein [Caballeronia sp. LZ035]MDR5757136.1 DUF4148 domain-containing protein [Caballeronia sp. LZ035]
MKKLAFVLLASMSLGIAAQASAQTSGLTRAEVRQQLVQAEAQGVLPSNGVSYPPSAQAMAHNRARYEAQHEGQTNAAASRTSFGGVADEHASN